MSDEQLHYDSGAFMAHRSRVAQTIDVTPPPTHVALPGALTPISVERLQAHQEDGLAMHEIVAYENARFLDAQAGRREKHRAWVARDYDARVQAHREMEEARQRQAAEASAAYQQRLAEILAGKNQDA